MKQLQMLLPAERARAIPVWTPPAGYVVRAYQPGDEVGWSKLLVERGFDEWGDIPRLLEMGLKPIERLEGSRLVVHESGEIVAATMASQRTAEPLVGALDFVVGSPEHAGKGLGYGVCAAVVAYLVERGYPLIVLGTDDWRLAAIVTYLKLGFEPDLEHDADMPERWAKILAELKWPPSE